MSDISPALHTGLAFWHRNWSVSSTGQMGRGDDDDGDGYSIPAQVEACEREAHSLGARLAIRPYIERAESAAATIGNGGLKWPHCGETRPQWPSG